MDAPDFPWHPDTLAVTAGRPPRRPGAPVSPGIELSSTYVHPGAIDPGIPLYGRYGNQTWAALEDALGALEGAPGGCLTFASGMAAGAALYDLVPEGGRLVVGATSYNTMLALARERAAARRCSLVEVEVTDGAAVRAALVGADWLHVESPTNPLVEVADLPDVCAAAHEAGARVSVDNTFATPLLQQPLAAGADVVLHSATKYLSGHSDVLLGALVTADADLHARIQHQRDMTGGIPGPFEAWLTLRGLRTLPVRIERAQASARVLAARLRERAGVERVRYPGFGAVLAIEVADADAADAVTHRVRLWTPATSLGGVESLIERRRRIPSEPTTVPPALLRLSVGIEHVEDLWSDLDRALG